MSDLQFTTGAQLSKKFDDPSSSSAKLKTSV